MYYIYYIPAPIAQSVKRLTFGVLGGFVRIRQSSGSLVQARVPARFVGDRVTANVAERCSLALGVMLRVLSSSGFGALSGGKVGSVVYSTSSLTELCAGR